MALWCGFLASIAWVVQEGGWGPRYLLPVTPFLVLAVAVVLAPRLSTPTPRRLAALFLLVACALQVVLAFDDHNRVLYQNRALREQLVSAGLDPDDYGPIANSYLVARVLFFIRKLM